MIKFLIKESPDQNVIGNHVFIFDRLYIGRSPKKVHLAIEDKKMKAAHLLIAVDEGNQASVLLTRKEDHLLINNKKVSGHLKLRAGDILKIADTTFEILEFKKSLNLIQDEYEKKMREVLKTNPKYIDLVEEIEHDLISLETP